MSTTPTVTPRPSVDPLLQAIERERSRLAAYSARRPLDRPLHRAPGPAGAQQSAPGRVLDQQRIAGSRRGGASGLPIDGAFSTLIVRDSKNGRPTVKWDPTYRGMIALALASGFVTDVQSGVVRDAPITSSSARAPSPSLVHRRSLLPKLGTVIAAWSTAKLSTGGLVIEILTMGDIAKIRAMSPAGDKGPWGEWADMMARKSAIRRLLHKLPAGTVRLSQPMEISSPVLPARTLAPVTDQRPGSLSPEEEFALESSSLERLNDANSAAELEANWAAVLSSYQQRGGALPLRIEATHRELAEHFAEGGA